jgi:hypothetical protein
MIDGIAQQVSQRRVEMFQDVPVDLGLLADNSSRTRLPSERPRSRTMRE